MDFLLDVCVVVLGDFLLDVHENKGRSGGNMHGMRQQPAAVNVFLARVKQNPSRDFLLVRNPYMNVLHYVRIHLVNISLE